MYLLISLALFVSYIFLKESYILIASSLFAIADAIRDIAIMIKKN